MKLLNENFHLHVFFFLVMFNVIIRKRFFFYTLLYIYGARIENAKEECGSARRREIAIESERVTRRNRRGKVGYERRVRNNDQKEQRRSTERTTQSRRWVCRWVCFCLVRFFLGRLETNIRSDYLQVWI